MSPPSLVGGHGPLRRLRRALLPLIAAALALGACKREERLAQVNRILVSDAQLDSHPRLDLDPGAVATLARKALEDHGGFELLDPDEEGRPGDPAWQARGEIVYLRTLPPVMAPAGDDASQPLRAEVGVELSLTRGAGTRIVGEGRAQRPFLAGGPEARESAFRGALAEALEAATTQVALHLETATRSEDELVAALQSPDGQRREIALRVLADRRSPAAIPHLLERLAQDDRNVQLRAVGGLVAIGDPKAVPALVDASIGRDPSFVVQIAYAIGEIGGAEAEAYLFTLSTGHPEAIVRQAAQEALDGLRTRARATASNATPRGR